MLLDELKKANMQALRDKDSEARAILSVLINKCMLQAIEMKAKDLTLQDSDVLTLIQKVDRELDEELAAFQKVNNQVRVTGLQHQKQVLLSYLPKQLSEVEIRAEIASLPDRSLPSVMAHFKKNFSGKCDMKVVSTIAKLG